MPRTRRHAVALSAGCAIIALCVIPAQPAMALDLNIDVNLGDVLGIVLPQESPAPDITPVPVPSAEPTPTPAETTAPTSPGTGGSGDGSGGTSGGDPVSPGQTAPVAPPSSVPAPVPAVAPATGGTAWTAPASSSPPLSEWTAVGLKPSAGRADGAPAALSTPEPTGPLLAVPSSAPPASPTLGSPETLAVDRQPLVGLPDATDAGSRFIAVVVTTLLGVGVAFGGLASFVRYRARPRR